MDLPAVVLTHVRDLTASVGQDDQDLSDTLMALATALRSTATSYRGFQLTLVENQWPVTLTAFDDGHDAPIGTSLRLPLGLVSRRVDGESRVVFFAGTPGAFTDLAADLSHALGGISVNGRSSTAKNAEIDGTRVDGHRKVIELDIDLLPALSYVGADRPCRIDGAESRPRDADPARPRHRAGSSTCCAGRQRLRESNRTSTLRGSSEAEHDLVIDDSTGCERQDWSTTMNSDVGSEPSSQGRSLQESHDQQPDQSSRPSPAPGAPFVRHAGWLSIAAGALFLIAQTVMSTFDQRLNLEASQNPVFIAAKIIYLAGFVVLMFALIAPTVCRRRRQGGWVSPPSHWRS